MLCPLDPRYCGGLLKIAKVELKSKINETF